MELIRCKQIANIRSKPDSINIYQGVFIIASDWVIKEILFFEDADDVFKKFYEEIEIRLTTDLKPLLSWAGKLCGSTARIAGLLARANNIKYDWGAYALDHKLVEQNYENGSVFIFKEDAENAIKIARYFIEHAKYAFNSMGLTSITKIAIDIVDYIKTLGSNK